MAKTFRTPPAELYGIIDDLAAYCFNRAIYYFGSTLDADLANAGNGAKNAKQGNHRRAQVMAKWLGTPVLFRDPAAKATPDVVSSDVKGPVKL